MKNTMFLSVLAGLSLTLLTACGDNGSSGNGADGSGKPTPANRVNWEAVPAEFNPSIEDIKFQSNGYEKISVNVFGFDTDVEVVYASDMAANTGVLRIFKVWKKSASWGQITTRSNGTTLDLRSSGSYQCSIEISNGAIGALEGGCYVRLQVFLPAGAELEVYNAGQLISKRFIPMDAETFLKTVHQASWADDKFAVIADFLASYKGTSKSPALTSEQLGAVIGDFMRGEDKLEALRRLHAIVSDRQNLGAMIDDKFTYFDRDEARAIAGI